ncbi:MAG: aldolase [Clostridiales bacterium]|nr:aldolase [Clostridiales bacterium]
MALELLYITNKKSTALIAEKYGVGKIWVDLETEGKESRQPGNTVKSRHRISDIAEIKPLLTKAQLIVRVNPWSENSPEEINAVIDAGADIVMLPMWKSIDEVRLFLDAVGKRAKTNLLLETKEAVDIVDDVLKLDFDEIHIGLNDLHLSYGMTFMFELLADGTVERLCNKFKAAGKPYGFGGIAKLGDGLLPAEKIVMEHYRLGSTMAILSRTFCDNAKYDSPEEIDRVFRINMKALREYESSLETATQEDFLRNKEDVALCVADVVAKLKKAGNNEL